MPILALFAPVISWFFRAVVIKFLVMAALFVLVAELTPWLIETLGASLNTSALSSSFTSIPSGVWYFLDFFALDIGLPLMISAHITRFLIRRLPVIG